MLNVVPELVLETYELGKEKQEFEVYSLFADISGFTAITEELSKSGKQGAEILTDTLNTLFSPLIDIIYQNNGFISTFAGDAFTAFFTEGSKKKIHHITEELYRNFNKNRKVKTPFGEYLFSIKIGAGSGNVVLKIVEGKEKAAFYFYGDAIRNAVNNEEMVKTRGFNLKNLSDKISPLKRSPIKTSPSTQYLFYPDIIVSGHAENTFRSVISVFINTTSEVISDVVGFVLDYDRNAYLNKVDYGDKGFVILVIFGAPYSREADLDNAVEFSRELINKFDLNARIGMSFSTVYAGIIGNEKRSEYTVIGKGINLAARLMQKAEYGTIYTDRYIKEHAHNLNFSSKGRIRLKGFHKPVDVYSLEKKSYYFVIDEGMEIIGNKRQASLINKHVKYYLEKRRAVPPLIIKGESGSGKTHLAFYGVASARKKSSGVQYGYFDLRTRGNLPGIELLKEFFLHIFNLEYHSTEKELFKKIESYLKKPLYLSRIEKKIITNFLLSKEVNTEGEIDTGDNTVSAVHILLRLISSTYPLILTFDNIEDADSQTRKFIEDISTLKNRKYLLIIITELEDYYMKNAISVTTSPLTFKDIERLFKKLMGKKPHSSLIEYIAKMSSGNLKMASEIVKLLDESGNLSEESGYLILKNRTYELPESINHVLLARYDALPSEIKGFLKYASIMGMRFSSQILLNAFLKGQRVENTLLYLLDKGIILKTTADIFVFRDHLLRDVIYSTLPFKFLKIAHRKIADIMEKDEKWKEDSYSLFYHNYMAGRKRKTLRYGKLALQRLSMLSAYEDVLNISDKLLQLVRKGSRQYTEILMKKADALYNLGRVNDALKIYNSVIESTKNTLMKAWALYKSAYILDTKGNKEIAEQRLKEAIRIGKRHRRLVAQCYLNLGILYQKRDGDIAMFYLKKAYEHAEGIDEIIRANAILNIGIIKEMSGNIISAKIDYEQSLKTYKKHGYTLATARVLQLIATNFAKQKDTENALKFYKKAYEICKKYDIRFVLPSILTNMGTFYAELGKFRKGIIYFKKAERLIKESGKKVSLGVLYNNFADVYLKKGNLKKARRYSQKAIEIADTLSVPYYMILFRITLVAILWELKNCREIEKILRETSDLLQKYPRFSFFWIFIKMYRAKLDYIMGKKDMALKKLMDLKDRVKDPDLLIKIEFEIWKINRNNSLKQHLLTRLKTLYEKYKLYDYFSMLKTLSSE